MSTALKIALLVTFFVVMAFVSQGARWLDAEWGPAATFGAAFVLVGIAFLIEKSGKAKRQR